MPVTTTLTERAPNTSPPPARHRTRPLGLLACLVLLALAAAASLAIGAQSISPGDLVATLLGRAPSDPHARVVTDLRLPRTVVGLMAGTGLGVAGALVQAVTRNPLADPGILGTTSGAAFAVAMTAGLAGAGSPLGLLVAAFVGAAAATVGVYAVGSLGRGGAGPITLVLAGTALGAVLSGITSAIVLSDPARFAVMQSWRAGSLADRGWGALPAATPFLVAGLVLAFSVAGSLNTIALGDDLAASLGANIALVRTVTITAVTLLAGVATAIAGPIAFVGLMVPHLARWFAGPDQPWIIAFCAVLGPTLLLLADVLGRVVMPPGELPAGIVTAFVGAPVLIAIVRRRRVSEL